MKTLYQKFIKNFYGIVGPFDEYKQNTIGRHLITIFPLMFFGINLIVVVALLLGYRYPEIVSFWGPFLVFVLLFISYFCLGFQLKRANVNDFDMEELSQKAISDMKKTPIRFTGIWTLIMFCWLVVSQMVMDRSDFWTVITNPRTYVGLVVGSVIVFGTTLWSSRQLIHKKEKELEALRVELLVSEGIDLIEGFNQAFQKVKKGQATEISIQNNIDETLNMLRSKEKVDNTNLIALDKFYQSTCRYMGLGDFILEGKAKEVWKSSLEIL